VSLLDLLTLTVLTVVGVQLVTAARASVGARRHVVGIVSGLRARHMLLAVPVLAAVFVAVILLLEVPGMAFGWWTAIGGVGNPVFGTSEHGVEGTAAFVVPLVFGGLLVVSLPLLVEREEWVFRRGAEDRPAWANAGMAVVFGLVHTLVGIPVGAALGLSLGGLYFTHTYLAEYRRTRSRDAAVAESTRAHLGYNLVIVSLVVVALALGA
jgi:hypothetical protein